jgi:hypothetical protein
MIAGVLRCLGVFMGHNFGEESGGSNHEDLEFQQLRLPELRKRIAERDAEFDVWGWKDPGTILRIEDVAADLRNPIFISVFRDPYAIALSEKKYNQRDIIAGLKVATGHLSMLSYFKVSYPQYPNLPISYEKALADKKTLINEIIVYLNLNVTADQRQKAMDFIQPERYVNL